MKGRDYINPICAIFTPIAERQDSYAEAEKFLTALDPNESNFAFRLFGESVKAEAIFGSLEKNHNYLLQKNIEGAGIYVTVNKTDGKGVKAENIVEVRALFLDFDNKQRNNISVINSMPIEPSIVVCSSELKFHCYFKVDGVPLEEFKQAQDYLNRKYDADPSINDLPRIMRLPGFYHNKDMNNLYFSRIVGGSCV